MRGRLSSALRWLAQFGACAALCLLVANCADKGNIDSRYGVSPSARLVSPGEPVPKGGGVYRVGSPYMVGGRVYVPHDDPNYNAVGLASWYGDDFYGRETANGEIFDVNSISAAHPTLPLPSYVRVTNLEQRTLADRAGQRPRAVSRQSHHRRLDAGCASAWLHQSRALPGCACNMSDARRSRVPTTACWRQRFGTTSRRRRHGTCGSRQRHCCRRSRISRRRSGMSGSPVLCPALSPPMPRSRPARAAKCRPPMRPTAPMVPPNSSMVAGFIDHWLPFQVKS